DNMPKVNDEYLQDKREQILDAAYRVCMKKPVYSIVMKDIITELGWSQGAIYRYFKSVHDIFFELINRQTAHLYVKEDVYAILSLPEPPECIVSKILDLITQTSMMNIKEFGKMYFEYSALIANQPEYLEPFSQKVKIATDLQYLQKSTLEYIITHIERGYFKPLVPIEDIFLFIETSIDGIQRDLVLVQCSQVGTYTTTMPKELDPQKLMNVLCRSVIYLLGGNSAIKYTTN
ncbi:MAG: TetR/AcrR family transcriptional regulator, partial [Parabacteroides sp.]|nr:TetR/AcrR family transcriptional regulator [Parabacteroides sp.]